MDTPDYAKVQQIFIGIITAYTLILVIVGPECVRRLELRTRLRCSCARRNHGSHFEKHKVAFEEGAARDDAFIEEDDTAPRHDVARSHTGSLEDGNEKEAIRQKETV